MQIKINSKVESETIPLIIANYNQLFCLVNLINWWNYYTDFAPVFVIDNNSAWPELLEFYDSCGRGIWKNVTVKRYPENTCGLNITQFLKSIDTKYYCLSNSDIAPGYDVPEDFLDTFKYCLDHYRFQRVGFILNIENLPDYINEKEYIQKWEGQFYNSPFEVEWKGRKYVGFKAPIDMTFAMYQRDNGWERNQAQWLNSLRLFRADHLGWYVDRDTKIRENVNYFTHCKNGNTSKEDGRGVNHYNPFKPFPADLKQLIPITKRWELINKLIAKNGYKSYLEIGVQNPANNFDKIKCIKKTNCDPDPKSNAINLMTSDAFFAKNREKFDIVFVDGLHHSEQAYTDILNSLNVLTQFGVIIVHDCNPTTREMQETPIPNGIIEWTGDVWRSIVRLRTERNDLEIKVVDIDYGCGIIRRARNPVEKLGITGNQPITYESFAENKVKWLNLVNANNLI